MVILWKIELFVVLYSCNHNLFLSELKLEHIVDRHNGEWSFDHGYCLIIRVMSISVRPVHIEWFRFNFVFSRVSLATTNAVTELQ